MFGSRQFEYITLNVTASISNLPQGIDEMNLIACNVFWELDFEARRWGMKTLNPVVRCIRFTYKEVVYVEGRLDKEEHKSVSIELPEIPHVWAVTKKGNDWSEGICPKSVDIQWDRKEIEVTF